MALEQRIAGETGELTEMSSEVQVGMQQHAATSIHVLVTPCSCCLQYCTLLVVLIHALSVIPLPKR
jgi:hypothetical protein